MYNTHVTATGASVLLHERKTVRLTARYAAEHHGQIPLPLAARQQCSTFPLVFEPVRFLCPSLELEYGTQPI